MIRALHASNFRSLGDDVTIAFPSTPPHLVALAGPNAAGKSNALDGFRFVADALRDGLGRAVQARGGFKALQRDGSAGGIFLAVELLVEETWWVWGLWLSPDSTDDAIHGSEWAYAMPASRAAALLPPVTAGLPPATALPPVARRLFDVLGNPGIDFQYLNGMVSKAPPPTGAIPECRIRTFYLTQHAEKDARLAPVLDALSNFAVYTIDPLALREPQTKSTAKLLLDHMENWTSVLQRLLPEYKNDLLAGLGALVPDLTDIRIEEAGDHRIASFEHRSENSGPMWIPANRESDGTLRTAAMLTALLQDPPPSLIAIEEPELAVHVRALAVLRDYLLPRAQNTPVLLSTHSTELLDLLLLESIRVVERGSAGTSISELSARQHSLVADGVFTLGQLVLAQPLEGEPRG